MALYGNLGAGKTTLAKGIAVGLGVRPESRVTSPTFALIHEYRGRVGVYHLDWYRLKKVAGVDQALARECFEAGGVTLVEWPERGGSLLPRHCVRARVFHRGPGVRAIEVSGL